MTRGLLLKTFFSILLLTAYSITIAKPVNTKYLSNVPQYIRYDNQKDAFSIAVNNMAADICISASDHKGVNRAATDLSDDIRKVTGTTAKVITTDKIKKGAIIIGTIGKSKLIDGLIKNKKLDVTEIKGKWESFVIQTIGNNLVVAGSDKRGTIYGIYDISEKIGVSPWYWWADVPARKSNRLYVSPGRYVQPSPKVKYRGIFINDEWPSFGGWAKARFGGINSDMYAHLFELLLRLKANFLWPAMWDSAFNEDDPKCPELANMYGIVMGTSHHEPMMRAHKEYTRRRNKIGPWDYNVNKTNLDSFFSYGIERNKGYDNMITIGMRGDGDVAMGKGDDEANMKTLTEVITSQRNIISKAYDAEAKDIPQLWAIFTEVQRYYDKGFNIPDDVLLLFCDNNWGYIRRTGPERERNRKGGMGLYYHIDMNGGPWNDRWVNTTTIPKLREQLGLAYKTGIDDLWIINVGDLKPKEIPIDFIMRYAWNPDAITANDTYKYTTAWAAQNFGDDLADDIAYIISRYSKYNLWRKAEVQRPGIFSVANYHETEMVDSLWNELKIKSSALRRQIPKEYDDAFFQLVYYPTVASAGVAQMFTAATRNNVYAAQQRPLANHYAETARRLFEDDSCLTRYYNDTLSNGKWKNMMSDKHIGYTHWYMPERDSLPQLQTIVPLNKPCMGINVEGSIKAGSRDTLPTFDILLNQSYYIDIFNRGKGNFNFTAKADKPWVKLSKSRGNVTSEERITTSVDWTKLANGKHSATITISDGNSSSFVTVNAVKAEMPKTTGVFHGNFAGNEFSIPAYKYTENIKGAKAAWITLPDLGRGKACMGSSDVTACTSETDHAARLEYQVLLPDTDSITICIGILPTQDIDPERGLRLAIGLDNNAPTTIDARQGLIDIFDEYTPHNLAISKSLKPLPKPETDIKLTGYGEFMRNEIFDNIRWLTTRMHIKKGGMHRLKIYMIDPEIVIERIIFNPDNRHPSYFGAPEKELTRQ